MPALTLTRHGGIRANQSCVTLDRMDALIAYADFKSSVGGRCAMLRFSRDRLKDRDLRASRRKSRSPHRAGPDA
jgi:hypothetical protein